MKVKIILFVAVIALGSLVAGCGGNTELKKEAGIFAEAMCRNIETMQKLHAANPSDTLLIQKIQKEQHGVDSLMLSLSEQFRKKYGEKMKSPEFTKEYRNYLNKAMLECKCLSKEDRATFEKRVD